MSRVLGMNETVSPGIRKLVVSWNFMEFLYANADFPTLMSFPTIRHAHNYSSQPTWHVKTCQQSWSLEHPPVRLCWALRDDCHMTESEQKHWLRPSANYLLRSNIPGRKSQEWGSLRLTGRFAWSCWRSTEQRYKPLQWFWWQQQSKNPKQPKGCVFSSLQQLISRKNPSAQLCNSVNSSIILISHWFLLLRHAHLGHCRHKACTQISLAQGSKTLVRIP